MNDDLLMALIRELDRLYLRATEAKTGIAAAALWEEYRLRKAAVDALMERREAAA